MKRWKIRQRLIYAVQPSISLCHSIYRRQFSKLDRPQHSFHHSHFHYIFDARSICIGFKHAPNTNSVRYSAVYVINVSIVTINDIHWSIYILANSKWYRAGGNIVRTSIRRIPFRNKSKCILSTHSFDATLLHGIFSFSKNHFFAYITNDEHHRIYSFARIAIMWKSFKSCGTFIWLPAFECCWWCAVELMRFLYHCRNEFYVHVNHPQSSNWKICWGPISKRIFRTMQANVGRSPVALPAVFPFFFSFHFNLSE